MPKASQQANNEKSKIAQIPNNLQSDRALGYFNWGRNTIKNVSNILPKLASKTMLQVGSKIDPNWSIVLEASFGRAMDTCFMVLRAKLK